MKLLGIVVKPSYMGRERRKSTAAQRRAYREAAADLGFEKAGLVPPEDEDPEDEEPEPREAKGWAAWAFTYLLMLPKPMLATVALLGVIGAGRHAYEWATGVNVHMDRAQEGYLRLSKVELLATATAQDVGQVQAEVSELRGELREMRRDQLSNYRWQAETLGDHSKAREMEERLKSIEGQP